MDTLIKIITSPATGFKKALEEKSVGRAIAIVVLTSLIKSLTSFPDKRALEALRFPITSPVMTLLIFLPILLIAGLAGWFIMSLLFHGAAKLFKGQGTFTDTLVVTGYAQMPYFFALLFIPLALAQLFVKDLASLTLLISITISLAQLALGLWVLILFILGFKEAHFFSYQASVGTTCLPTCGCLVLIGLIFFLAIIAGLIGTSGLLLR